MQVNPHVLYFFEEFYEPEKLLHRETQIQFLNNLFSRHRNTNYAPNIFIRGKTGTGKSETIKHVLKQQDNGRFVYVSGNATNTATKTLRALTDCSYSTPDRIIQYTIDELRRHRKVLIIDEVDKIKTQKELFNALNTIYRGTRVPIIIVSNKFRLLENLPDDARRTLLFQFLEFDPYNAQELHDILSDRLPLMPPEVAKQIPESAIRYICAKGAREGDGSARTTLGVIFDCLISRNFEQKYIDRLFKGLADEDWKQFYDRLTQSEKRFLGTLLDLYTRNEGRVVKTSDIKKALPHLLPTRVSQLVTLFEEQYEVITTKYVNRGRAGGKYRVVEFESSAVFDKLCLLADGKGAV